MKCRDFGAVLRTFAEVLDAAGAPAARDEIAMLATVFDEHPTSSVSDLANRVAARSAAGPAGSPNLGGVARLLAGLKSLLNSTAKSTVVADISDIEQLLRDRAWMELGAFVRMAAEAAAPRRCTRNRDTAAVRDDLVVHYKEKLEAALGDEDEFAAVCNDLRADPGIGKPEIVVLAKQMTGSAVRTQDAALRKICSRHQALMVFKAKSRATGGRSAA